MCPVFDHCEQFWPFVMKDTGEPEEMQRRVSGIINSVGQLSDEEGLMDLRYFCWRGKG